MIIGKLKIFKPNLYYCNINNCSAFIPGFGVQVNGSRNYFKISGIAATVNTCTVSVSLFIVLSTSPGVRILTQRLVSSFKPELDPQETGYTGMLQKEILENAKLIGEANTEIITTDDYIIQRESNYIFSWKSRDYCSFCIGNISYTYISETYIKCKTS